MQEWMGAKEERGRAGMRCGEAMREYYAMRCDAMRCDAGIGAEGSYIANEHFEIWEGATATFEKTGKREFMFAIVSASYAGQ
jgi:hypothetical protein